MDDGPGHGAGAVGGEVDLGVGAGAAVPGPLGEAVAAHVFGHDLHQGPRRRARRDEPGKSPD